MQGALQTLAVIFSTMCTIAILLDVVVGAPLVVAANRDELYARPTRPPESLGAHVAGGVDVLSGGTWLAIRRDGRFAAVTFGPHPLVGRICPPDATLCTR